MSLIFFYPLHLNFILPNFRSILLRNEQTRPHFVTSVETCFTRHDCSLVYSTHNMGYEMPVIVFTSSKYCCKNCNLGEGGGQVPFNTCKKVGMCTFFNDIKVWDELWNTSLLAALAVMQRNAKRETFFNELWNTLLADKMVKRHQQSVITLLATKFPSTLCY